MDAVAIDPIRLLFAAGEGRFEGVEGRLVEVEPRSEEHAKEMLFLASAMSYFAEDRDTGQAMPDQFAQRLDQNTVRVPDVAFF